MPECPVSCGFCCHSSWTTVKALIEKYPKEALHTLAAGVMGEDAVCPEHRGDRCGLSREDRPKTCQEFLCNLGRFVLSRRVSRTWVWKYYEELGSDPISVLAGLLGIPRKELVKVQNDRVQLEWEQEQLEKKTERRCLVC